MFNHQKMGDLKPIGSEKLKGDAKIQRILELTYFNSQKTNTAKPSGAEYISETVNGVYGIVKEKDGYYVKKGLNENSLDYIGGLFMKNKNKFHSYAEALKRLDYIQGQETLTEDTKYVLKVKKPTPQPAMDAPAPAPDGGEPGMGDEFPPSPDMGDETDMGDDSMGDTGMEGGEDDYLKTIQKLTGKLGQKLRGFQDKLEGDDVKYVINSVLSALDLDKLEMTDKEEILNQFEDDEEGDNFGGEPTPETDVPAGDMGGGVPGEDTDLGEDMDALEQLINTPLKDEEDVDSNINADSDSVNDVSNAFDKYLASIDGEDEDKGPFEKDSFSEFNEEDQDPDIEDGTTEYSDEEDNVDDTEDSPTGLPNFTNEPTPRKINDDSETYDKEIGEPRKNDVDREFEKFLKITNNLGDGFDDDEEEDLPLDYNMGGEMDEQGENIDDSQVKEIEIDELTNMINNTVKETLGKYFN